MTDRALIVLTSHGTLGDTGKETGFYWEELATPYRALVEHGLEVDIASVAGGEPPADPNSATEENVNDDVRRFRDDDTAMKALKNTAAIETVDGSAYRLLFLPGGHGTMFDLSQTPAVARVVAAAYEAGAVVGAVCHGPAGLLDVTLGDGRPLVEGRTVTGFTDEEEKAVELDEVVPFLLETRLRDLGADFVKAGKFEAHAVRDGRLVTGQNPASSKRTGELLIEALNADE